MSSRRGLLEVFKLILEHNDYIGEQRIQLADSLVSQISEVCKTKRKDKEHSFKKVHIMYTPCMLCSSVNYYKRINYCRYIGNKTAH